MLIVMPSDPMTEKASVYLNDKNIAHQVIEIPDSLGYKTGASKGIYLEGTDYEKLMIDLSADGFIIMRVFRQFEI